MIDPTINNVAAFSYTSSGCWYKSNDAVVFVVDDDDVVVDVVVVVVILTYYVVVAAAADFVNYRCCLIDGLIVRLSLSGRVMSLLFLLLLLLLLPLLILCYTAAATAL